MNFMIKDTESFDYGKQVKVMAAGGSRTFGNTVIIWDPSTTEAAVKVTVNMGGVPIKVQTLTPNSNMMTYNGASGEDWSKGKITAAFGPTGKSGTLSGDLTWCYQGDEGRYAGYIGSWEV